MVNTGQGVLTLTGYTGTATGGTISYSYTLSATIDNTASATAPDSVDGTGFNDSVALTVNGVGGTTASDDLVIRIVNDLPTANVDGPYGLTEDGLSNISRRRGEQRHQWCRHAGRVCGLEHRRHDGDQRAEHLRHADPERRRHVELRAEQRPGGDAGADLGEQPQLRRCTTRCRTPTATPARRR